MKRSLNKGKAGMVLLRVTPTVNVTKHHKLNQTTPQLLSRFFFRLLYSGSALAFIVNNENEKKKNGITVAKTKTHPPKKKNGSPQFAIRKKDLLVSISIQLVDN